MKWFYDFEELAAEWQVSEKFLLELGILEPDHMRLHFSVKTANGLIALSQRDIYQLLMSRDRAIYVIAKNKLAFPSGRILVDRKSLAVEWKEVERIEEKYPLKQPPVTSEGQLQQPNSPEPTDGASLGHIRSDKKGGRPPETLRETVEAVFNYLQNKGDEVAIKRGNVREFLRTLKRFSNDNTHSDDIGLQKLKSYVAERIKDVKIPRAGNCSITTQERQKGKKTTKGETFSQGAVSKLLTDLRKKTTLQP